MLQPLRSLALLTSVLIAAFLGACGSEESGQGRASQGDAAGQDKIRITFLTMQLRPTFDEYFFALFDEYEQAHPNVEIDWQDFPFDGYETKLMTSFLSRTSPDVINIPSESLPNYIQPGHLLALDELVDSSARAAYVPSLLQDAGVFREKLYALPWYASTPVTFANRELLEKAGLPADAPPLHNEQLREYAEKMRASGGAFAAFPLYTEHATLKQHLMEGGVRLFSEDGTRAVFNTPRGVEVFKFWTDLYRDGLVPSDALTATHRRPIEMYKTGNLALLVTGPQFLAQVRADAPSIYANTLVGPQLRWADVDFNLVALHTLAVSSQSRHPEQAADFAAFITNGPNQLRFAKIVTIIPSVTSALDDPYFTQTEDTLEGQARRFAAEQTRRGTVYRPPDDSRRLNEIMEKATEDVALGRREADEALKAVEEEWNAILGQ